MKYIIIIILSVFLSACNTQKNTGEPDNSASVKENTYGAEVDPENSIDPAKMLAQLENNDSIFVTVKGEITSTCKMKGCWMKIALPDGEEMRVSFRDYGFFVPREGMEGKTAIFEGWVTKSTMDEATRRHFAKDAGKSEEEILAIKGDVEEVTFVADGVRID